MLIIIDNCLFLEQIVAFSWEPVGNKFAIIHGDTSSYSVSFYGINKLVSGGTVTLLSNYLLFLSSFCLNFYISLEKLENKACNHLFWSPTGQFIVLAGLRSSNHSLEFIDTSDFTTTNNQEHFMATDVEWDPTGRYVVTGVSWWAHKV